MMKQMMIPVAAFMLTATGVSAFNSDVLEKVDVDLTTDQIEALEEAHELRHTGDYDEARTVIEAAGLDRETMRSIRSALHEYRHELREQVRTAVAANDYDAFSAVIVDTPMADKVNTEADFDLLVEAHALREAGDRDGAREIMAELGFSHQEHGHGKERGNRGRNVGGA